MKSLLKNVFACSVLMLASVAAHATTDHLAFERVVAHADLSDRMASAEDEQAESSDADTMLA